MRNWLFLLSLMFAISAQAGLDRLRFITEEYPPYNYTEKGRLQGIAIELLESAFEQNGQQLDREKIELLPWARGYETVLHTPNSVLFSTTRTDAREALFQWAGPISADRVVLMAHKANAIQLDSIEELNQSNLQIVVIHEDIGAQRLQELGVDPARIHTAINNTSALAMLDANRVDLWAYGEDVAFWLMDTGGYDRQEFEPVYTLSEAYLYFALNSDTDPDLTAQLQAAVNKASSTQPQLRLVTEEYPPYNYINAQGEVQGTATELIKNLLQRSGLTADFQLLPWARALTEAQMRENTCVFSTTRTVERNAHFEWIGPLLNNQWGAFSLASSTIKADNLDDLVGLRIGSFREDAVGNYVQDQGLSLILATTDHENLNRLSANLIDVWVTGVASAEYLAEQQGITLNKLFVFNEVPLYLACNKTLSPGLKQLLQTTLEVILKEQTELTKSTQDEVSAE
ncbi:substrate-binding periplasmic protein [Nitrincola sp. A-D6]|uniref:substrate-binding periplasmic protein n=1 Tax=Nitrincola sp. A-D6 TaxID=1545442 RepID=UPI0009DF45DF|nr:transporter substrate-binding domain-containing protein [Nitrincola sp. A-D6]